MIENSGCYSISKGNFEQFLQMNKIEINEKTLAQFEPSKAFGQLADNKETRLKRVGEYNSYVSDEEYLDSSEAETGENNDDDPATEVKNLRTMESEFD